LSKLADAKNIVLPVTRVGATHVYHIFCVLVENRDEVLKKMAEKGIGTLIHYPVPPHLQQAYKNLGYKKGDFPIAEKIAETCLSLPCYPGMTEQDVENICKALKECTA
jgi:dTDP-4-amino-4,6-dideoxygalactose transaminase